MPEGSRTGSYSGNTTRLIRGRKSPTRPRRHDPIGDLVTHDLAARLGEFRERRQVDPDIHAGKPDADAHLSSSGTHRTQQDQQHNEYAAQVDASLIPSMFVVAIALETTLVSITTVSPAVTNRDEDAARQQLQTDECEEDRSEEGDSPTRHNSSP